MLFSRRCSDEKSRPAERSPAAATRAASGLMLALEPRYLYDAAGLIAGLEILPDADGPDSGLDPDPDAGPDSNPDGSPDQTAHEPPFDALPWVDGIVDLAPPATESPSAVVFVDPRVSDHESLVDGTAADTLVVILDPEEDGVARIGEVLSRHRDVSSVHILSHGSAGRVTLGNAVLSGETIDGYAGVLQGWRSGLATGADILVYGCNVAEGAAGQAFTAQLADMTGADVAASDDPTGAAGQGGDWDLETRIGRIETSAAFSAQAREAYAGTLAAYTVTEAGDNRNIDLSGVDPTNGLNLREALYYAVVNGEDDTIDFAPALKGTTNTFNYGALFLTYADDVTVNGDIDGDGNDDITLDANGLSRVFEIHATGDVTLNGLHITGGYSGYGGGGIYNEYGTLTLNHCRVTGNSGGPYVGGGIYHTSGMLRVYNSTISDNTAFLYGGGIYNGGGTVVVENSTLSDNYAYLGLGGGIANTGDLTVTGSTVSDNLAPYGGGIANFYYGNATVTDSSIRGNYAYYGGGILNIYYADLNVYNSTLSDNYAYNGGGGILNLYYGTATVRESTVSGNYAYYGGGIANSESSRLTLTRSTVHGNYAPYGGGLFNYYGTFHVLNSTISGNQAYYGGGAYNTNDAASHFYAYHSTFAENTAPFGSGIYSGSAGNVYLGHTIVTGEVVPGAAGIQSRGYNLFAQAAVNGSGPSDILDGNAALGALADHGGPTWTHMPGPGSDALEAGDPGAIAGAGAVPSTDQRGAGFHRVVGTIDIGATENQPLAAVDDTASTEEGDQTVIHVLQNDSDSAGNAVTILSWDTTGTQGKVTYNGDGTFTYDPNGQFDWLVTWETATDTFTYTVVDANGNTATATVFVTIVGKNDAFGFIPFVWVPGSEGTPFGYEGTLHFTGRGGGPFTSGFFKGRGGFDNFDGSGGPFGFPPRIPGDGGDGGSSGDGQGSAGGGQGGSDGGEPPPPPPGGKSRFFWWWSDRGPGTGPGDTASPHELAGPVPEIGDGTAVGLTDRIHREIGRFEAERQALVSALTDVG